MAGAVVPIDRVVALVGSAGSLPTAKRILATSRPNGRTIIFLCYHRTGLTQFDWSHYVVGGYRATPARDGEMLVPDTVYHPDRSMTMTVAHGQIHSVVDDERPRPSLDKLLASLAAEFGPRVHAFLLSGLGQDGLRGLVAVRKAGGMVFVEHPDSAAFRSLPSRIVAAGLAHHILHAADIVKVASRLASGETIPALGPEPTH